jgi:hypothetical protein
MIEMTRNGNKIPARTVSGWFSAKPVRIVFAVGDAQKGHEKAAGV